MFEQSSFAGVYSWSKRVETRLPWRPLGPQGRQFVMVRVPWLSAGSDFWGVQF